MEIQEVEPVRITKRTRKSIVLPPVLAKDLEKKILVSRKLHPLSEYLFNTVALDGRFLLQTGPFSTSKDEAIQGFNFLLKRHFKYTVFDYSFPTPQTTGVESWPGALLVLAIDSLALLEREELERRSIVWNIGISVMMQIDGRLPNGRNDTWQRCFDRVLLGGHSLLQASRRKGLTGSVGIHPIILELISRTENNDIPRPEVHRAGQGPHQQK